MSEQTQTLIGGKTVSEKYTIKENKHDAILFDVLDDTNCLRASLKSEILAQEYISLLNYNDKRKSLPKIYKNYKKLFLIILNKKLNCFKKGNVGRLKSSDYYSQEIIDIENSIKAIESLECE